MKKIGIVLSWTVGLMLLSFTPQQQKKVVRLKKGNFKLNELKMETRDVEAIQKLAEELAEQLDIKTGNNDQKGPKYEDLLTIYEAAVGWEAVAAFGNEDEHYVLTDEIATDAIKTILVYRASDKENDEKKEDFMAGIDRIMNKYLD